MEPLPAQKLDQWSLFCIKTTQYVFIYALEGVKLRKNVYQRENAE